MIKIILLGLMLLILPICYSFDYQTSMYATDTGLQIFYSGQEFYKVSDNFKINVMVINLTNYVLNSSLVSCNLNIYNNTGYLILNTTLLSNNTNDLSREITGFNSIGFYSFNIFCNTTSSYGMYSSSFKLTKKGGDDTQNSFAFISIIVAILGLIYVLIIIAERMEFGVFESSDGKQLPAVKYMIYLLSGWIFLIPLAIINIMIETYNLMSTGTIDILFSSVVTIMIFFTMLFVIGFGFKIIEKMGLFQSKE